MSETVANEGGERPTVDAKPRTVPERLDVLEVGQGQATVERAEMRGLLEGMKGSLDRFLDHLTGGNDIATETIRGRVKLREQCFAALPKMAETGKEIALAFLKSWLALFGGMSFLALSLALLAVAVPVGTVITGGLDGFSFSSEAADGSEDNRQTVNTGRAPEAPKPVPLDSLPVPE